jgi:hypothetical protein
MDARAQRFNWWLSVAFCVVYTASAVMLVVCLCVKASDLSVGARFLFAIASNWSCLMVMVWWPSRRVLQQQYESIA